jgi:hypothetical protein
MPFQNHDPDEGNPSMTAKPDLEKRIDRLKDRIQKADEDSERPLPPDKVRTFRKRLKRTQRKLAKGMAREEKAAKPSPAETKPAEEKPKEEKASKETPSEQTAPEETAPEETAPEETSSEQTAPEETAPEETGAEETAADEKKDS